MFLLIIGGRWVWRLTCSCESEKEQRFKGVGRKGKIEKRMDKQINRTRKFDGKMEGQIGNRREENRGEEARNYVKNGVLQFERGQDKQ